MESVALGLGLGSKGFHAQFPAWHLQRDNFVGLQSHLRQRTLKDSNQTSKEEQGIHGKMPGVYTSNIDRKEKTPRWWAKVSGRRWALGKPEGVSVECGWRLEQGPGRAEDRSGPPRGGEHQRWRGILPRFFWASLGSTSTSFTLELCDFWACCPIPLCLETQKSYWYLSLSSLGRLNGLITRKALW